MTDYGMEKETGEPCRKNIEKRESPYFPKHGLSPFN